MRKYLLAALAASTVVASPAMAQNWQGKTYGQDAWGEFKVKADVSSFCKFGIDNSGQAGTNGTADTSFLGGANEADGRFLLDIQDPNDDTVRAANAQYNIGYAVCNSPFKMQLRSVNGGLKSSQTTSDNAFIELIPYRIHFAFDGNVANERSDNLSSGFMDITDVTEARAGAARVRVAVGARDRLLLQGTYSDRMAARLSPYL